MHYQEGDEGKMIWKMRVWSKEMDAGLAVNELEELKQTKNKLGNQDDDDESEEGEKGNVGLQDMLDILKRVQTYLRNLQYLDAMRDNA